MDSIPAGLGNRRIKSTIQLYVPPKTAKDLTSDLSDLDMELAPIFLTNQKGLRLRINATGRFYSVIWP
jgi:hypothetical protein